MLDFFIVAILDNDGRVAVRHASLPRNQIARQQTAP